MASASDELLELYKLATEMADRVTGRRATANNYLFTIHAALLTGLASGGFSKSMLALAGLILAAVWFLLLRSYRDLNRAKFDVILAMEKRLAWRVYGDEWASLKRDPIPRWRDRYAEFGTIERLVPAVLAVIYVAALVKELLP